MADDREALLQHYRQMREQLLSAIDGVSDELMTEPSIDGWSVKDHLAHIATWDDVRASEVARISAGHDSAWRMTADQDEAYNAIAHDLRLTLSLDQVRWELATSRQKLVDAISSATGTRTGCFDLRRGGSAQLARSGACGMDQALARRTRRTRRLAAEAATRLVALDVQPPAPLTGQHLLSAAALCAASRDSR